MPLKLPPYPVEYLDISFSDESEEDNTHQELHNEPILPFGVTGLFQAPVKCATYLTKGNDVKTVIDICIDIKDSGFQYQPGNTIGVIPLNNINEVNEIIDRLKFNHVADKLFKLSIKKNCAKKNAKLPPHIPVVGTIRDILIKYLDIRCVPKKLFLRAIGKYTTDEADIKALDDLCSTEGAAKYTNFITKNYITLLELLKIFKSSYPPFTMLLEHLPRLQPRPYSITSSPDMTTPPNTELNFVFSLEILPKSLKGVCTGWLNDILNISSDTANKYKTIEFKDNVKIVSVHEKVDMIKIPIYLRKSNEFKLPENKATDIIMIGSGTGLAPFIGFLRHREIQKKSHPDLNFGTVILFFGCRYSNCDFLFKTEINSFIKSGTLSKFYPSFSRENADIRYVQDNIKVNQDDFIELLDNEATIYVCGSANMCRDVFATVSDCLCKIKKYTYEEAQKVLSDLRKHNKYVEDVWS